MDIVIQIQKVWILNKIRFERPYVSSRAPETLLSTSKADKQPKRHRVDIVLVQRVYIRQISCYLSCNSAKHHNLNCGARMIDLEFGTLVGLGAWCNTYRSISMLYLLVSTLDVLRNVVGCLRVLERRLMVVQIRFLFKIQTFGSVSQ